MSKKLSPNSHQIVPLFLRVLPYLLCVLFFVCYATLSIVRYVHYQSGYDLGINDQVVWRYSIFQPPLTTTDPYPAKVKLYEHVELVYALIAPAYWLWSNPKMLLLVRAAFLCAGGIAVFLLARRKKVSYFSSIAVLVGYLAFYGIQFSVWNDVHSIGFGAASLAWFIYFLDQKKRWRTIIFFLLAITAKENVALLTLVISFVYFLKRRDKMTVALMLTSLAYLIFIFFVYFPYIIHFQYPYRNKGGILSNLNPLFMVNTNEKLQTIVYTLFSFGFLSLLNPLYLLPMFADLATYFVIASDLPGAQGLYLHYRVTLAPLMAWATIMTIAKYQLFNTKYVAYYLLFVSIFIQYFLHLPLSYLSKSWFWQEPSGVKNIETIKKNYLPPTASVVAQINIISHITHRDKVYSLYPETDQFTLRHSPCGKTVCHWFRWFGNPEFLFVDTSPEWDARTLLVNRDDFIDGLKNLEKAKVIAVYKRVGNATLYKVNENPEKYDNNR